MESNAASTRWATARRIVFGICYAFIGVLAGCNGGSGLANLPPVTPQQAAEISKTVQSTTYYVQLHPADAPTRNLLQTLHDSWHAGGVRIDYIAGNDGLYDGLVSDANAIGLKLAFITPYGSAASSPASYASAAGVAAKRYAGNNIIWELYNEPNLRLTSSLGTGLDAYITLAKLTAVAIRENDPTATIITGGTGGPDTTTFTYAIAAAKALAPYVNGVSIHPYGIAYGSFGSAVYEVHAATNLPVYISEWGDNNQQGLTQAMQSAKGLTPMFCAYEYQEQPDEIAARDDNWSLVSGAWRAFAAGAQ